MNPPQVYMCSPSWTLLPPPSPYHPSGSSQCTSPKHPVSRIEPELATRSIYDIIHISSHSPKSSHPLPLPQSPKDCSIHQCLNEQCKEVEESNRIEKSRDPTTKVGSIKGTFHARMGTIKARNSKDITEAEEIKKKWQEYTEELSKNVLMTRITKMVWPLI